MNARAQDLKVPGRAGSSPAVVPVAAPAWKLSGALAVVTAAGTIPTCSPPASCADPPR